MQAECLHNAMAHICPAWDACLQTGAEGGRDCGKGYALKQCVHRQDTDRDHMNASRLKNARTYTRKVRP